MDKKRRTKKEANRLRRQRNREAIADAVKAKIDPIRERYAKNWSEGHALRFAADGHYQWMADFVKGRPLVLEIGTGDGTGTLASCANASIVVSVDKNPFCLERAHQKFKDAGVPVIYEPRGKIVAEEENSYAITFGRINSAIPASGALLVGGDILIDDELKKWLFANAGFDAIICWNIGTFQLNTTLASNEEEYRLKVQNRIYELADHLLTKDGILHIVDRGRALIEGKEAEMRAAMVEAHLDQASVTSLRVRPEVAIRPYSPPHEGTGIGMKAADTTTFDYDANDLAFWSIISDKP